jgi:hypothetical protein
MAENFYGEFINDRFKEWKSIVLIIQKNIIS